MQEAMHKTVGIQRPSIHHGGRERIPSEGSEVGAYRNKR